VPKLDHRKFMRLSPISAAGENFGNLDKIFSRNVSKNIANQNFSKEKDRKSKIGNSPLHNL